MFTIWKFPVPQADTFDLELPHGARFLALQIQMEKPQIWFLVNTESYKEQRRFAIFGTGHPIPRPARLTHLGTFQLFQGEFVGHLFEYKP